MNVLVVAAHGLACHWLGPYGNAWVSTPAADALAAESTVFDRHFADEPSPVGFRLSCSIEIHQALRAANVSTILVDDRKVRTVDHRCWDLTVTTDPAKHSTPGQALIAAVRAALDRLPKNSPWLLWIETDRLIPPWDLELETYQQYAATSGGFAEQAESQPADPTDEPTPGPFVPDDDWHWHQLHNSFAAAVTSFDGELATLMSSFRERGLDQSAAWILTSGYGWPLGEHGIVGPVGSRMHKELVHIPLIVRLPPPGLAMRREYALTQTSDLGPSLAELFGIPTNGSSLLHVGTSQWRKVARSHIGDERGIRTDEWAFVPATADVPARLYLKPDDIWEVNDLAARHPDECDRLLVLLNGTQESKP